MKSIAILVTGKIKEIDIIVKNLISIREQFQYLDTVHIYFHTWESESKNDLHKIEKLVDFMYIDVNPNSISAKSKTFNKAYNSFCMFIAIYNLTKKLQQTYTYVCRCRNDFIIKDDFIKYTDIIDTKKNVYITPPLLWMFDDGCNDHFGICNQDIFMKIWGINSNENLGFMFKTWKPCPETLILIHIIYNKIDLLEILPEIMLTHYNYVLIKNRKIVMDNLNNYAKYHVSQKIFINGILKRSFSINDSITNGLSNYLVNKKVNKQVNKQVKIAFHINQFSIRGTEIAIFDYAYHNINYLNNNSIIVAPVNHKYHTHPISGLTHNSEIEKRFSEHFELFLYKNKKDLDDILIRENCDGFYILKTGYNDGIVSDTIPTFVHCVFKCLSEYKHGTIYSCISNTVNEINAPVVPHICNSLPKVDGNLREKLGIPTDATVFGRYGGIETFDIDFVKDVIKKIVKTHPNIYFLFMNTQSFFQHPQVIYTDKTTINYKKALFVNTCDAMLHARKEGESFGLSIAEFTSLGKPILTWKHEGSPLYHEHLNHIDVLGDSGMYYKDEIDLYNLLTDFKPIIPVNFSDIYSIKNVMTSFQNHFLSHFKFRVRILCNWKSSTELYKNWKKMLGDLPIQLVTNDPDYTVVINKPPEGVHLNRGKTIVMGMEPDTFTNERWNWYGNKKDFLYFLDEKYMNNCEWWLSHNKKELLYNPSPTKTKDNTISSVVSSQYIYPGHILRVDFLKLAEKELKMDIYGWDNGHNFVSYKGSLPKGKEDGLEPYKYTFASENSSRSNYFTEKLVDAILSECLCFYWGCPNLENFIDPKCCIYLDITKPFESIKIIKKAIDTKEWEKRLPIIRNMKHHILKHISFFPRLLGLIKLDRLRKRTVNLYNRPEKWNNHLQKCSDAQLKNVERFSAIIGDEYPTEKVKKLFTLTANFVGPNKNTSGIMGCALSHYTLWKEIKSEKEPTLIMEDDVTFLPRFADRMSILLQNMETIEWDIVFLGFHKHEDNYKYHNLPNTHLEDNFDIDELVPFQYMKKYGTRSDASGLHGGGTFGYIISPRGAKKMVEMVDKCTFYFPVDYQIIEAALRYDLKMFICSHPLLTSPKYGFDTNESDIQRTN